MTLSAQLETHIADGQTNPPKSGYLGPDWWQLSPEDELVFSIDRVRRWPRMMVAWHFYEIFLGIIDAEEWKISPDIVEAERVRRADIFAQGKSLKGFIHDRSVRLYNACLTKHGQQSLQRSRIASANPMLPGVKS